MGWLDSLMNTPKRRLERARELLDEGRLDQARTVLDGLDGTDADELREAIAVAEKKSANREREEAIEERHGPLWRKLWRAAGVQERRYHGKRSTRPSPSHAMFAEPKLVQDVPEIEQIRALTDEELDKRVPRICRRWPEDLRDQVDRMGLEFVRAELFIAAGRPALALDTLLDLPNQKVVLFERARVAFALGYPKPALEALKSGFPESRKVRGLQTGIFEAQLHARAGDAKAAVSALRHETFAPDGNTAMLYARQLQKMGAFDDALQVLSGFADDHAEASRLAGTLRTLVADRAAPEAEEPDTVIEASTPEDRG